MHHSEVTRCTPVFQIYGNSTVFFFNCLFRLTTKKHESSGILAPCEGNPPVTGGFPSQKASKADSIFISCHHPETLMTSQTAPVTGGFPSQRANNADSISISCHHPETRQWLVDSLHKRPVLLTVFPCHPGTLTTSHTAPVTGGFPSQRASNVDTISMSWCHPGTLTTSQTAPAQVHSRTGRSPRKLEAVRSDSALLTGPGPVLVHSHRLSAKVQYTPTGCQLRSSTLPHGSQLRSSTLPHGSQLRSSTLPHGSQLRSSTLPQAVS